MDLVTNDRLDKRLSEVKTELIKWMFIFWVGNLASVIAIIKFAL